MSAPAETLNDTAASVETNGEFKPYIADNVRTKEFTWSAVLLGSVLGIVFAASSLYLVLKVGMTVSASIPVAVLAITVFRGFSRLFRIRKATILENNIVQTAGSAGESIAFGVGVTMPALLLLGFEMDMGRIMVVAVLGGILGILAMIPLRRAFIVKLHGKPGEPGKLLYPEGTACAQVLISGEKGGTTGAMVFLGFGLAFLHKFVTEGMSLLMSTFKLPLTFINRAAIFANEMASELLGVGYIIGLRTSAIMMAGGVLGYLVLIPLIAYFGDFVNGQIVPPSQDKLIKDMSVSEIRNNYLLFVGAGTVATAGIISMFRTLPMIVRSIRSGLSSMKGGTTNGNGPVTLRRTENDMSMKVVLFGSLGLIVLLAMFLTTEVGILSAILGAVLVVLFGFLFVTVSARLTGEIGSSSNPISGMTVATLTLTCLIFLMLGMRSSTERVLALSIAAVVCVAASNGGTTAQSLKTGFLVGGTPKLMQYAILIGALTSALVIGGTLIAFNAAGTVHSQRPENLPDITLTQQEREVLAKEEPPVTYEGKSYLVWDTRRDAFSNERTGEEPRRQMADAKKGHYLVDPDTGQVKYLIDPGIMGQLTVRDDGQKVKRDFDAPKTQVMGLIIDGVLSQRLNWSLVLLGAMIAIMLELCGVSALAFAVGVYVDIKYSAPIFFGGVIRYAVDWYMARSQAAALAEATTPEARAQAEIEAIRQSETSPGVLMASGFIAGGSLAGMLIAFTAFSDDLPKQLTAWQYRTYELSGTRPWTEVTEAAAMYDLGLTTPLQPDVDAKMRKHTNEIAQLNSDVREYWVAVPKGTVLKLPGGKTYEATKDTHLGAVAEEVGEGRLKPSSLLELNTPLKPPKNPSKVAEQVAAEAALEVGRQELGLVDVKLTDEQEAQVRAFAMQMEQAPEALMARWAPVARGLVLKLPGDKTYEVKENTFLGMVAKEQLGSRDQAPIIVELNNTLRLPDNLPAKTLLKLPQRQWPAVVAFVLLMGILFAAGTGRILKPPPTT